MGAYELGLKTSLGKVNCKSQEEDDLFYAKDLTNNLPTDTVELEYAGGVLDGQHGCESETPLGAHAFVSFIESGSLGKLTMSPWNEKKNQLGESKLEFSSGAEIRLVFLETASECVYRLKSMKGETAPSKGGHFAVGLNEAKVRLVKTASTADCPTKATFFTTALRLSNRSTRTEWLASEP